MTGQVVGHDLSALPLFDGLLLARDGDGDDVWLIGWRCERCERLSFGAKRICPLCGARHGRTTRLQPDARLETWTQVSTHDDSYVIGYALVGDGEDDQQVRVFGPLAADDVEALRVGQAVRIGFASSTIAGEERVHHVLVAAEGEDRLR